MKPQRVYDCDGEDALVPVPVDEGEHQDIFDGEIEPGDLCFCGEYGAEECPCGQPLCFMHAETRGGVCNRDDPEHEKILEDAYGGRT